MSQHSDDRFQREPVIGYMSNHVFYHVEREIVDW